jgi:RNA polymerase sigma-70 factor (ECF subfamily)
MSETTRLAAQAVHGDDSALAALLRRHERRLLAFFRARQSSDLAGHAAEDLVQETLLTAARKITEFRVQSEGAAFYRWLVGIGRHKLSEARRAAGAKKRAAVRELGSRQPAAGWTSPSLGAARGEAASHLAEALDELPERQAEAVRLRYLEGRSVAETAEALDSSEASVKALVGRGLRALAGHLRGFSDSARDLPGPSRQPEG